ncbi:MAG: hypothetical protein LBL66_04130 [Clostridiales bacterium]|nr:hypothetical protein [Clostridiales bacterium]
MFGRDGFVAFRAPRNDMPCFMSNAVGAFATGLIMWEISQAALEMTEAGAPADRLK